MNDDEIVVHEDKVFEKIEYREKTVDGREFIKCIFKSCNLSKLSFERCYFKDCVFDACDLSLIKVKGSRFNKVTIINSKAIGIAWYETGKTFSVNFKESNISYSSFCARNLDKAEVINCMATETDFSECSMVGTNFNGSDLSAARFTDCDLSLADFRTARNYTIDLKSCKVKKARFSLPEVMSLLDGFDIIVE